MSSKRVHCTVEGLDDLPTVKIVDLDLSPPKAPKPPKQQKAAPRTTTFQVAGSLPSILDPVVAQASKLELGDNKLPDTNESHSTPPIDPADFDPFIDAPTALEDEGEMSESDKTTAFKKGPNHYLEHWLLESSQKYLQSIYTHSAPPIDSLCNSCQAHSPELYRCATCLASSRSAQCANCLLLSHRLTPTHRVETWDGSVWAESSLSSLGLVLHLGHQGRPCALTTGHSTILVGDVSGFYPVNVHYCAHADAQPKALQLLDMGLFPSSDLVPKTAFTLALLDMYDVFLTLGCTSGHILYMVLERITQPGFPGEVKDRYRQLMFAFCKFLYIMHLVRSGEGFDKHITDVHVNNQALDCVACPQIGINFNWSEVLAAERAWFRWYGSYDGNFQSWQKLKRVNPGDICLSDGRTYFPMKGPYKVWTESQKQPQRTEKPACNNHKAGNDTSVRWVGQAVTGIGAFTCTSHSCFVPRGMVDFFKGERFVLADYAFASLASYLTKRGPLAFGMTYNVWCHWIINFRQRALNLPPGIALPADLDLIGAIGKWHIIGHDPQCYICWALNHMQYMGRMEGEGPERVWAHLNEYLGSTSERGPGVRTNSLNNVAWQWNFEKMIWMHRALPPKFLEAKKMFQRQKVIHDELTKSLPAEKVEEWAKESLEPVQGPNKRWTSPLMDPIFTDGKFQEIIWAERKKESPTARVARRRPGATRWLSEGIELEHHMCRIELAAKEIGSNPTPKQANTLNSQRMNLRDTILEHQKQGIKYMSALADTPPDHPKRRIFRDTEPKHTELALPSVYTQKALQGADLESLGALELELRRGMCNDALESTRQLLGAKAFPINYKEHYVCGEVPTTRAESTICKHSVKIDKAQWRYNNSRNALLRLGPLEKDMDQYLELTNKDLTPLKSWLDETRGVGQGYMLLSWIWRVSDVPITDDWQVNALRTEWFRSRERYKRWEEQLVLLKREMVMTMRTFRKRKDICVTTQLVDNYEKLYLMCGPKYHTNTMS